MDHNPPICGADGPPPPWRSSIPAAQSGAFQISPSSTSMWRGTGTVNMTQPQNTLNAPTGAATVVNVTHVLGDEMHRPSPALTREIAIPSPRADHEIYYHQLLTKRRGSPLWIPGPGRRLPIAYRMQGISFGDVGIITHFGRFDFLFNIFQPANHPINSRGVPESFSPLDFGQLETDPSTTYGDNTYLTSSSVTTSSINSSGVIFESTAQEAAILTMPEGALTEDLLNGQVIRDSIAANARTWYEYARRRRGRIVQNGEIRVVVGWDKVRSWGIATSTCNSGQSASLAFKINDETGTSRAYCWQCIGSGSGRVGPPEDEISDLRGENDATPQNQCVFVRTMNFTLAGHIWDDYSATAVQQEPVSRQDNPQKPHNRAGGGTSSSASGAPSGHESSSVYGGSHTLQSVTFDAVEPGIVHPSSSLHEHLLEKYPSATIIITQDADWISALTDEDTSMPQPGVLWARISASRVIYERDGMVTIQEKPSNPDRCDTITPVQGPRGRYPANKKGFLVGSLFGRKRAADTLQDESNVPNFYMPQLSPNVRYKEHLEGSNPNVPSSHNFSQSDASSDDKHKPQRSPVREEPQDPRNAKKSKKEAARLHREAELEKRKLLERNAREQARAILLKRHQQLRKNVADDLEWSKAPMARPETTIAARIPPEPLESLWRGPSAPKARLRPFDDDPSMSSSDVSSISGMSSISSTTVDSDPGMTNSGGLFGITSRPSLRTFDDFPSSARTYSYEKKLAHDFSTEARVASNLSGTLSPPSLQILSLSPEVSPSSPSGLQPYQQRTDLLTRARTGPLFRPYRPVDTNEPLLTLPSLPTSPYNRPCGSIPWHTPKPSAISNEELSSASIVNENECKNCKTTDAPLLWRSYPEGQPLCHECGLFHMSHGVERPISSGMDDIKNRNC